MGINSSIPLNTLVVQEPTDNNPSIKLFRHSAGGDIASIVWATDSGSQAQINYRGASPDGMQFYTGGTASSNLNMIIDTSGRVGINEDNPTTQFIVKQDGLADNTYSFATTYKSGNNASGYTASGIQITGTADDSNGDKHSTYINFNSRDPSLNGNHGASAFMVLSNPDSQGSYGTGQFDFYIRSGAPYAIPNDPQASSSYWMSSILTLKGSGRTIDTGTKTITGGTNLAHQSFRVRGVWSGSPSIGKEIELISGYDSNVKMAAIGYNLTDTSTGSTYGGDLVFHTQPLYSSPTTPLPVRMRISSSGYVTKPVQPGFGASNMNGWTNLSGSTYAVTSYGTVHHNYGSHFNSSNGRFTAPVDGRYFFHAIGMGVQTTAPHIAFGINNSSNGGGPSRGGTNYGNNNMWSHPSSSYYWVCITHILDLSANDYVRVYTYDWNSSSDAPRTYFYGYLMG